MNPEHLLAQIVLRAWPFGRGIPFLMRNFFSQLSFSNEIETVRTTDGFFVNVVPNDLIGRLIYLSGEYDRTVPDVLRRLSRPGDVLLDVGANIGYVSASFLHSVPDSRVIAVEPQSGRVANLLEKNLEQFPGRYRIAKVAMSNAGGLATFDIAGGNLGDARFSEVGTHTVQMEMGDHILYQTDKLDLIKMDIQGHELVALQSMLSSIDRLKPRAILFEDDGKQIAEISRLLGSLGYSIRSIQKTMFGYRLSDRVADNYLAELS